MKKSKLIIAFYITTLALSTAALSMSLAWYATSNRLRINSINITIDCTDQLAISTKSDTGYVANLTKDDLNEVGAFVPVTSAYQSSWYDAKKDMPLFYDDTVYSMDETASTTIIAERGYLSQKLYLRSDVDCLVSIDPEETYIHPNAEFNKSFAEKLYNDYQSGIDESLKELTKEEIENRLNSLVNAMRYSVLVTDKENYQFCIIDPNKTEETTFGGLLDNNSDRYYDYFKKDNSDDLYERVYGEINGGKETIVYDAPEHNDSSYLDEEDDPSAFNAKHRADVYRFNLEESVKKGLSFKTEESYTLSDFEKEEKPFVFPVYKGEPREIVLSIYIEGWDLDSINYTMGATFNSNIVFEILERIL